MSVHPRRRGSRVGCGLEHRGLAAGSLRRASGVQASDQHKCPSKGPSDALREGLRTSGVKTDIVCAGHSLAAEGRVPLYAPRDSE